MNQFLALITVLSGDAHPEHPIVIPPPGGGGSPPGGGGQPPGIWGGGGVPMPTPPIANVPGAPGYDPGKPPTVWPEPNPPHPAHPIVIPPEGPPPGEQPPTGPLGVLEWHSVWTQEYGWAMVGVQTGPHVAPSGPKPDAKLGTTKKTP